MGHTPYGYRFENGRPVIDDEKAGKIKALYAAYLSGLSLDKAAALVGIKRTHSVIKNLLVNSAYLGKGYYPKIIDQETFDKAEREIKARAEKLAGPKQRKKFTRPLVYSEFSIEPIYDRYDDPFQQAEYVYGMIRKENSDAAGHEHYSNTGDKKGPWQGSGGGSKETGGCLLQGVNGQ